MTRLFGKSAFITGAAQGIGFEFAKAYVAEGAKVVLADIDQKKVRKSALELGDTAFAVELDVRDQESINLAVEQAIDEMGCIDILINNAALFTAAPITDIDRDDYLNVFSVNVSGVLFTMQAVARHMIGRGNGGKIINMASQAGRRGEPLVAVYCASKAAVISLTQSAGLNLIKYGINVNAIAPGVIDTPLTAQIKDKPAWYSAYAERNIFKRWGGAREMAGPTVFLASEAASYVTGTVLFADGGWTAIDGRFTPPGM